jgi:hypothetical protein
MVVITITAGYETGKLLKCAEILVVSHEFPATKAATISVSSERRT